MVEPGHLSTEGKTTPTTPGAGEGLETCSTQMGLSVKMSATEELMKNTRFGG